MCPLKYGQKHFVGRYLDWLKTAPKSSSYPAFSGTLPRAKAAAPHTPLHFSMGGNVLPPQEVWRLKLVWCWQDSDDSFKKLLPEPPSTALPMALQLSFPEREISWRQHKQCLSTSSTRKQLSKKKDFEASEGGTKTRTLEDWKCLLKKHCKTNKKLNP